MKRFGRTIIALMFVLFSCVLVACDDENKNENNSPVLSLNNTLGVWWWTSSSGLGLDNTSYHQFAKQNGVDEIYYCDYELNSSTASFVKEARNYGMKTYALWGEKEWLLNDENLIKLINDYKDYQTEFPSAQLSGIHLDIEPHQYDDFNASGEIRKSYITRFVKLVKKLNTLYSDITFDYDIPFWLHDEITIDDITKPAYEHIIDSCNRAFVMSYRDTAEKVCSVASEEVAYAKQIGKQIFVSVEMSSTEGDNVSFAEESKEILYSELNKIKDYINYDNFGVSIHHIKSWQALKER